MIKFAKLENFTVFEELDLSLSPKVNILMGANGTGKTHLLKAIYGLGIIALGDFPSRSNLGFDHTATGKFLRLFSTADEKLGKLHTTGAKKQARLRLQDFDDSSVEATFGSRSKFLEVLSQENFKRNNLKPVFIPTKEVSSLAQSIQNGAYDRATVEMIFDGGYIDLAELLVCSRPVAENPSSLMANPRLSNVVRELVRLIGGRYRWRGDQGFDFESGNYEEVCKAKRNAKRSDGGSAAAYQDLTETYFVRSNEGVLSSDMTADGYRKIGMLHHLLCNGSIKPGKTGVLLWDEPESNLNPAMMKTLVQLILELSRNGQQIIVATHDYAFLKWFDLLVDKKKDDHIRFHALHSNGEASRPRVAIESSDRYSLIAKTAISDTFAELYDEDVSRALGNTLT